MADLHTLSYVETDIPAGMTLAEYRRARPAQAQRTPTQGVLAQLVSYARWPVRRTAP